MPAYVRTIARRVRRRAIISQLGTRAVSIDHPRVFEELVDAPHHGFLKVAGEWIPKLRLLGDLDCVLAAIEPLNRVILHGYYEGFSCAELSDRYALPVEAIKGRLYRIRHHIRAELTRSTRPEAHQPL